MAVAAEVAVREWINARPGLTGKSNPLSRGAFLAGRQPRSPAHGAYALITRDPAARTSDVVCEDNNPSVARLTAHVFAGTIEAAETAAVALANAFQDLNGRPEPCGSTGITVMVADNFSDPSYIVMPGTGGEQHAFSTSADFMLLAPW